MDIQQQQWSMKATSGTVFIKNMPVYTSQTIKINNKCKNTFIYYTWFDSRSQWGKASWSDEDTVMIEASSQWDLQTWFYLPLTIRNKSISSLILCMSGLSPQQNNAAHFQVRVGPSSVSKPFWYCRYPSRYQAISGATRNPMWYAKRINLVPINYWYQTD